MVIQSHIIALSGGKDSTAMAIRLKELYPERKFTFVCTPTGDELPEMISHWDFLEELLGSEILRITNPKYPTIYKLIEHFKALPNFRQRWCTRILKIEAIQQFYQQVKPAIIYVGLRADEQARRGNRLLDADITQSFPLQNWGWGIKEVLGYLKIKSIEIPRRTDCAMCFFQRIGEWWMLWAEYPEHFKKLSEMEDKIGKTLMTPGKHKIWPHKLSDLSIEFAKGRKPKEILKGERLNNCRVCSL